MAWCTVSAAFAANETIDFKTYRPIAVATRIDPATAPKIDGDLSDSVWAKAKVVGDFYQIEPTVGGKPTYRTEARILFDDNNLYVAYRAFDSDPAKITRGIMKRDGAIWKDDAVRVTLDPQDTGRHGYTFEIGSGGVRWDALIQNGGTLISEWNTIWDGHTKIDEQGWTAEFAIPFKSLSFNPNLKSWGLNLGRTIRRLDEPTRWSNISNSTNYYDFARSGRLEGIEGITQGLGLDVEILGSSRYKYEWDHPRQGDLTAEPSANVYYKITPSLQGTLTLNTDFSDSPLDSRQVNTGRFGLFIPETRDFFLQDASIFEFGGRGLAESPNGRPFFTRNIGITDYGVADIIAGGKLSGSFGDTNVAALVVKTAGVRDFVSEKTLGAVRVAQPIFGRSQIGAIFTFGDPSNDVDNKLGGFDLQIRDNSLLDREMNADFYFERSDNDGVKDDAFGFELSSYEDDLAWWINGKQIGDDFKPALGFVNRTGFKRINTGVRYRVRPQSDWMRFFQFEVGEATVWTSDNHLDQREMYVSAGMVSKIGDELFVNLSSSRERIPTPFNLAGVVLVPAKIYDNWDLGVFAGSSDARWYSVNLNLNIGEQYDGDYYHAGLTIDVRPSPYYSLVIEHDYFKYLLPAGTVDIHVDSAALNVNFSPDMTLTLQSEYDNLSAEVGLSARLRWEFEPGAELFASVGHAAFVEGDKFISQTSTANLRIGNTFRF